MSDLREQLAARLAEVIRPIEGIVGFSDYEETCDLARADECIRQMEWARREATKSCEYIGEGCGSDGGDCECQCLADPFSILTAAPDNWSPNV